jgi:AcrR family transcriptional regulator
MNRWSSKETMHERILGTAGRLFYGQGIRAVGVDTIAAEIGISKRTLYNYFPSKDALILAYLSRHFIAAKTSDRPLLEQIMRYFDWLERWFASDTFRGCPFVNAVAELGDETHPGTKMAVAFKEQRRLWLVDALTRMNVAQPDLLATQVAILVEGAIIAALVRGDPTMARAAKAAARVLLTAAGVAEDGSAGVAGTEPKAPAPTAPSAPRRSKTGARAASKPAPRKARGLKSPRI